MTPRALPDFEFPMASLLTHPIVPLTFGFALGSKRIPVRYWLLGAIASMAADADVVAFALRIPYESQFGHRGATHSIFFAIVLAALVTLRERRHFPAHALLFGYLFASAISHPLLDMLTDGGLGIALFWPLSTERFFFPATPLAVSPIGAAFFSAEGVGVVMSELEWIWIPCAAIAILTMMLRKRRHGIAAAATFPN